MSDAGDPCSASCAALFAALAVLLLYPVASAATVDGAGKAEPGRLPTQAQLEQALGLAAQALEQQRRELKEEERRLEQLKNEIRADLTKLDRKLKRLEEPMDEEAQREQRERTGRIKHIAKSLTSMDPQSAAIAVASMEDDLAVELMSAVDGKKAGKIFEAMEAKRAAVLMQKVINQRKSARVSSRKAGG